MPPEPAVASGLRVSLVLHKFSRGGSDRVAAYLARGFATIGMNLDLIVLCRGGEVEAILTELVGSDIPIHYLGRAGKSRGWDLIRSLPRLIQHLRRKSPDVIISTANNTSLVTAIGMRLAGLRNATLILKTTNPIATSRHTGLVRLARLWSYRLIFRWTTAMWTLSAEESEQMRREFPGFARIFRHVDNPYVTPAMLAPSSAPPATAPRTKVISIARLTAQKRLDRLIQGFAQLSQPDTHLLILGEGEERAALSELIDRLGLRDRVAMPGYAKDVAEALRASDLFVLTSDYEGLPAVVLEAMAANCPVICTNCFPSAQSLLGAAEGCALTAPDPASIAQQIDAALALARPTSLKAVAERYSIDNGIASHVEALLAAVQT
ncbi:glycosyltransferase [Sphingomonas sp.]|uniref:glycosyltransferase n=1 Tax=Sphingomonas sp. TaxID=28214 RepID=UPI00286CCFC4|nr:glycosyltransferase [Sphingomonas sp.]